MEPLMELEKREKETFRQACLEKSAHNGSQHQLIEGTPKKRRCDGDDKDESMERRLFNPKQVST